MSSSDSSDPTRGASGPPLDAGESGLGPHVVVDRAAHLTDAFDWMVRRCREAVVADRGLHHVAHYSAGVYDFAVDVLDSPALVAGPTGPARDRRAGPVPGRPDRHRCADIGRRLSFKATSVDHTLEEVRTGQLVRVVMHTEGGVVYCNAVTPGGYIVALAAGAASAPGQPLSQVPAVREADRASSELATTLRGDLSLGSFDPGGWRHEGSVTWLTASPPGGADPDPPPVSEDAGGAAPYQQGDGAPETVNRCVGALDPAELVYLAHYRAGSGGFSVDLFDHQAASRFFTHITVPARRKFYAQFGQQFSVLGRQLAQLVRPLFAGRLLRVVLDTEQGAIYYYRLGSGDYLIGVTLSQRLVSQGDDRMAELASDLRSRYAAS